MIKRVNAIGLTDNSYEYDSQKTYDLDYAVYFANIDQFIYRCCPIHWHKEAELLIVTEGRLRVTVENREIELLPNEGLFINSNILHGFNKVKENTCFIAVDFDYSFVSGSRDKNTIYQKYLKAVLENSSLQCVCFSNSVVWEKEILQRILEIYRLAEEEEDGYELMLRYYLSTITFSINKHIKDSNTREYSNIKDPAVSDMIEFMKNNYMEKLTIKDIAKAGSVSERDCFRKFSTYMNTSPMQYLEKIRLIHAIALLNDTNKSVLEICYEVGFYNSSYFCKKFKQYVGKTPLRYREDNKYTASHSIAKLRT